MATDCFQKIDRILKEPIIRDGKEIWKIKIPCGKCARCITRRKMEWSFRMTYEMKNSKTAYFVTLTYDPKKIPYSNKGRKTLRKKEYINTETGEVTGGDLQRFFKRLRQNQARSITNNKTLTLEHLFKDLKQYDKIKYYAAGEYGEDRGRPHYHAIIFNASRRIIENSWTEWKQPIGDIQVVPATEEAIAYCTKYLDKRIARPENDPDSREPEYNTMSEKIGYDYIEKNKEWHRRNPEILYCTMPTGIKVPMPRYYREKIFSKEEMIQQAVNVTDTLLEKEDKKIKARGPLEHAQYETLCYQQSEKYFKKNATKRKFD